MHTSIDKGVCVGLKNLILFTDRRSINTHPNHEPGFGDDFNV